MEMQDKEVQFWDFQSLKEIPLPVSSMEDVLVIYAKENKIAAVPQNMFDYFPNLCELHVGGNEIKEVPADLFEKLYTLTLPNNRLNRLPDFGIVSISLMRLDISKNNITDLPKCFEYLSNLEALNMASNALTRLPPVILRMPSLKLLDISRNKISRLPEAISECQELAILIANYNRLTRLPRGICRLKKLIKLDVRSNNLLTLPINAQSSTYVNLTSFMCQGNPCLQYLTTLPGGDPETDEYLGYRDLTGDADLKQERVEDGWREELVQVIGDFSGETNLTVWIDNTWADRVIVINNPHSVVERLDNSAKDTPPSLLEICLRTMKGYPKHILQELPTGLLRKLDDVACHCCECKSAMFTYCLVAFAHYHMEMPSAMPFCSLTCMRSFLGVQFDPDEL